MRWKVTEHEIITIINTYFNNLNGNFELKSCEVDRLM